MKQHISVKQLNELSKKGKEMLRKWWIPKNYQLILHQGQKKVIGTDKGYKIDTYHDTFDSCEQESVIDFKGEYLPLLSIGQMIEFLDENDKRWIDFQNMDGLWVLEIGDRDLIDNSGEYPSKSYENVELADALWEACKEILNG